MLALLSTKYGAIKSVITQHCAYCILTKLVLFWILQITDWKAADCFFIPRARTVDSICNVTTVITE